MPYCYAMWCPKGNYTTSNDDRIYRFRSFADRRAFYAAYYDDMAVPKVKNVAARDYEHSFGIYRAVWQTDERGEYVVRNLHYRPNGVRNSK